MVQQMCHLEDVNMPWFKGVASSPLREMFSARFPKDPAAVRASFFDSLEIRSCPVIRLYSVSKKHVFKFQSPDCHRFSPHRETKTLPLVRFNSHRSICNFFFFFNRLLSPVLLHRFRSNIRSVKAGCKERWAHRGNCSSHFSPQLKKKKQNKNKKHFSHRRLRSMTTSRHFCHQPVHKIQNNMDKRCGKDGWEKGEIKEEGIKKRKSVTTMHCRASVHCNCDGDKRRRSHRDVLQVIKQFFFFNYNLTRFCLPHKIYKKKDLSDKSR